MSWQATSWAKRTRGHRSHGDKLVLMVLADYADTDTAQAHPSIAQLAEDSEMTPRNVIRCLQALASAGLIQRLSRGNQHGASVYQVQVTSPPLTPDEQVTPVSPTRKVQVTSATCVSDICDMPNLIEESIEESNTTVAAHADTALTPPQAGWHSAFHSIDGNPHDTEKAARCATLQKWIDEELPDGVALETAKDMRDVLAWDPTKKRPWHYEKAGGGEGRYSDLWLTFRRWAKRRRDQPQQPSWNGVRPPQAGPSRGHAREDFTAAREADEAATRRVQETRA